MLDTFIAYHIVLLIYPPHPIDLLCILVSSSDSGVRLWARINPSEPSAIEACLSLSHHFHLAKNSTTHNGLHNINMKAHPHGFVMYFRSSPSLSFNSSWRQIRLEQAGSNEERAEDLWYDGFVECSLQLWLMRTASGLQLDMIPVENSRKPRLSLLLSDPGWKKTQMN